MTVEPIGILPAAGLGTRMRGARYPKELLPVGLMSDAEGERPMLAAEYALLAMRRAGVRRCFIVVSDAKWELLRYLGDGTALGMRLSYLVQPQATGLAAAIDAGHDWVRDSAVCMAMPDTVFQPGDAMARVTDLMARERADLVLGVFPTGTPEHQGPVRLDGTGAVVEILDKPATTDLANTWGVAAWSPRFTALLHQCVASAEPGELVLGAVFQRALATGLAVRAVSFADGGYHDIGTAAGWRALVRSAPPA